MKNMVTDERKKLVATLLSFGLTVVTGVLGIFNWIMLRELLLRSLRASSINPWSWQAFDNFSLLIMGICWLSFVLYCQYYLMKAAMKGSLWRTTGKVLGGQFLLLFLCQAIPLAYEPVSLAFWSWIVLFAQFVVGLVLTIAPRMTSRQR